MKIEEVTSNQYLAHYINQIATLDAPARSNSKPCTFAMQFFCEPYTLEKNQGFTSSKALRIHTAYHDAYQTYFKVVDDILKDGAEVGYITLANGVHLAVPIMHAKHVGKSVSQGDWDGEYRSAGNAICQSYGSINTIAATAFMDRVWKSEWRYDIYIQNMIHDSIYVVAPDTPEAIHWVNVNLIDCMVSQHYPELSHPIVKLEAEMDVHTDWSEFITLPNNASIETIKETMQQLPL